MTTSTNEPGELNRRMEDIRAAASHPDLTDRQRRMLATLMTYMPFEKHIKKHGEGWTLSQAKLARDLYRNDNNGSRANVKKILRELRELGFITTEATDRRGGDQGSNRYFIEWHRLYTYSEDGSHGDSGGGSHGDSQVGVRPTPPVGVTVTNDGSQGDSPNKYLLDPLSPIEAPESVPGPAVEEPVLEEEPAWGVELDVLIFRTDLDGCPEADEMSKLYATFWAYDSRFAQQSVEALASQHPQEIEGPLVVLREIVGGLAA